MPGITDLHTLLAALSPRLHPEELVVCTLAEGVYGDAAELAPLAAVVEEEGLTLVVPRSRAEAAGLSGEGPFRRLELTVHSSLDAVGLTAAVAAALSERGLGANVIAGYHHDHLLVPSARADEALAALVELSRRAGG